MFNLNVQHHCNSFQFQFIARYFCYFLLLALKYTVFLFLILQSYILILRVVYFEDNVWKVSKTSGRRKYQTWSTTPWKEILIIWWSLWQCFMMIYDHHVGEYDDHQYTQKYIQLSVLHIVHYHYHCSFLTTFSLIPSAYPEHILSHCWDHTSELHVEVNQLDQALLVSYHLCSWW